MSQQFANNDTTAELLTMLTYGRPHATTAEAAFVTQYVNTLPGISYDKFGNGYVRIGTAPVLWSSHTDTVHHKPGRQQVVMREGIASLKTPQRGLCLGADDGAGVWLMRAMIHAKVPGLYVFHAGEEFGGIGSSFIVKNRPDLLREFSCAIAFDRKGTTSVITHQMTRTCSDRFGESLASALGPTWELDQTGTFTDTANYVDHIGECTNISVGYEDAHGPSETLDVWFLQNLRNELVRFDPSCLVYERKPGEQDAEWEAEIVTPWKPATWHSTFSRAGETENCDMALVELCRDYPEIAAGLIENLGGNVADMIEAAEEAGFDVSEHGR